MFKDFEIPTMVLERDRSRPMSKDSNPTTAQEVMFKVLAEKTKYLANPKFKEHIKKSPSLLLELLSL